MTLSGQYRRILQRMGYYNYQEGLIYRHLNQGEGWNSHLVNCRNFILKSLDYFNPPVITVLGSGWLLDLPLKEITERAERINLVDIIHPPEVKKQVADFKNVILHEEDVTGGLIAGVWKNAGNRTFLNRLKSIDGITITEYIPAFETGMVISLNILTQLETLPVRLLMKKAITDEDSRLRFRRAVQQSHMDFLSRHRSVLISDYSELITESSGAVNRIMSVLIDLPEGDYSEEWTWYFDLRDSDYFRKKSVFRVKALIMDYEKGGYQADLP